MSQRRLPVGAEITPGGGVHFRVWAPKRKTVEVEFKGGGLVALDREPGGYFSGRIPGAAAGTLYRYRLDGQDTRYPDPASRFQPEGPHGPSQVIDPGTFRWTDDAWPGPSVNGNVIYEMHVGTFTPEGTYEGAMRELPELESFGITIVEMMPVAEFPGRFGWGYDGVDLFAPTRLYGEPDDLRRFVDRAHSLGLGVILDVVYNHVGPDGNYLAEFSADYFTDRYENEWGEALNFDGENSGPVREFFMSNAAYWIGEFHMDGLRLDATQSIWDSSGDHILAAVVREGRRAAGNRSILMVGENEPQHAHLALPEERGGCGLDLLWNDDFHHAARVALTGRTEAYFSGYRGSPQEFISASKYGYLYQGQLYVWQGKRRGEPAFGLDPARFVNYIQNHDQVANSASGERLDKLAAPGRYRALTALLLLAPSTPMLFQGQEFAASAPFVYFADHRPELADQIASGRANFLAQFASLALAESQANLFKPGDPATFERCKLDLTEREKHAAAYTFHRDLLKLRREDPVFRAQTRVDGAVLGPEAFVLRFFGEAGEDRLLVVNLGTEEYLTVLAEPLVAPPAGKRWKKLWSSEEPVYGGSGMPPVERNENWVLAGQAAAVLAPVDPSPEVLESERRLEREAVRRKRQQALARERPMGLRPTKGDESRSVVRPVADAPGSVTEPEHGTPSVSEGLGAALLSTECPMGLRPTEGDENHVGRAFSLPPGFGPARRAEALRQPGRAAPRGFSTERHG